MSRTPATRTRLSRFSRLRPKGGEAGAGTALMAGVALSALLLLLIVILFAQASVAASRAATAADLAALAAADAARGLRDGNPCVVAEEVATQNQAILTDCNVQGPAGHIVSVSTEVASVPALPAAQGHARAGPPPVPSDGSG